MELYGISLSFIALCLSIDTVSGISLVCKKEKFDVEKTELIKTSARDFKDFVRHSEIFVDKSLLVNIVTQNASFVSLTFPKKWGKSINLDMLKTFLEIEVDSGATKKPLEKTWAYNFFKQGEIVEKKGTPKKLKSPPMVAKNETLMNSYLGQYPVIYLNLSSFDPVSHDFDEFFKLFRKHIADAFQRHEYMVVAFVNETDSSGMITNEKLKTKKLMHMFRQYQAGLVDSETGMITSLEFLSSILKTYFNQAVYVLIDDYDILGTSSSSDRKAKRIHNFYLNFLSRTFKENTNLRMGIVTGISNLDAIGDRFSPLQSLNYNLTSKNLHPFYGFTAEEVDQLLAHCSIEADAIERAKKIYTRHCLVDFPDVCVYDPSSILHLIDNRNAGKSIPLMATLPQTYIDDKLGINMSSAAKKAAELFYEFFEIRRYQDYTHDWGKLQVLTTFYKAVVERITKLHAQEGRIIKHIDPDTFRKSEELLVAHYLLLSYMKTEYGYDVRFKLWRQEHQIVYQPYMILEKDYHGAIIEFEYGDENCDHFSLARTALNRAKRFDSYLEKSEKFITRKSFIGVGLKTSGCTMEIQIDRTSYRE